MNLLNQSSQKWPLLGLGVILIITLITVQSGQAALQRASVASAPGVVSYQGHVTIDGQPYTGIGFFKFAVVNASGTTTYWSNNGTSTAGSEPGAGVALDVQKGVFTVMLGDTTLAGMTQALSVNTFSDKDRYLRVWFSTSLSSFTKLNPDQRIAAVPFALVAQEAVSAGSADLLDGQHASAFALSSHNHDTAYVNDDSGEVGDLDITTGALSPDRINGVAWTSTNDGIGSGLDADTIDGQHANAIAMPSGGMLLGSPDDNRLTNAGFLSLGISNVTASGYPGAWISSTATTDNPTGRAGHTAIWTGSQMIVWGGTGGYENTGALYNPITNTWTATNTSNAPLGRSGYTSVWTGTEMIVWGGGGVSLYNTGGRYNPSSNTWTSTSLTNAPSPRLDSTAVWTGTEMIVWGGFDGSNLNTGYRYNPTTDTWSSISTTNAPTGRHGHTAVWTGTEMIVWGGEGVGFPNTGGRYNPTTNTWTATTTVNAPVARIWYSALWTGKEMIVWGGRDIANNKLDTGGRYNPITDTWATTTTTNAPTPRIDHSAVWTGNEMIIWGGSNPDSTGYLNSGGRYNSITDSWTTTLTTNAPAARADHSAIWTGNEMIIWGGSNLNLTHLNTGGRYNVLLNLYQKP